MKKSLLGSLFTAAVLCTSSLSHASLAGFDDYDLGGTTASWDIFYGENYIRTWNFETGTVGNPLESELSENFTLIANNPGWKAGKFMSYATGPLDSDGETIPGNRDLFYTFFAAPVKFTIWGMVGEGETMDTFALQILQASGSLGGISNVQLSWVGTDGIAHGFSADDNDVNGNGVQYWTWSDLGWGEGTSFKLTFETNAQHSNIDAVQIQMDAQSIPEPTTWLLIGLGSAFALWNTRRRAGMTIA